jgi:protein O-GlcNAc transferase
MARDKIDHAFFRAALAQQQMGRSGDAERMFRELLQEDPKNGAVMLAMGRLMAGDRRWDEAINWLGRATKVLKREASAHFDLGMALAEKRRYGQAAESFRQAVGIQPTHMEAWSNLCSMLQAEGKLDEAMAAVREAILIKPDMATLHYGLGNVLYWKAEHEEAMASFRKALAIQPDHRQAWGNLLFLMNFHPGYGAQRIYEEHVNWAARVTEPLKAFHAPHANNRDPERRLKIGYVSPDFREHAECYFVLPLLEAHDHERFEIHCYSSVRQPDAITARQRKVADRWHDAASLDDAQLAKAIREDQIDILVDLTMHMGNNRILTFARKPAPVQVTWLAYPGTTGLSVMDYRITDAWMDPQAPEGDDSVYTERSVRLPGCWCVYHPLAEGLEVNELPAAKAGHVTFGSFNSFHKMNEHVLGLWAKAMGAAPGSRLMMLAPLGDHREKILRILEGKGVERRRVEFVVSRPRGEYLKLYHRIDIGLDPLPYNGITTTLDALWMGVPVLTRVGDRASGRAGLGILSEAGVPELASWSDEEFARKAVELSGDLGRMAELRRTLRGRLEASPLMDAKGFARKMEQAYRGVWKEWCGSSSGP